MNIPPKCEDLYLKIAELERREAALLEELDSSPDVSIKNCIFEGQNANGSQAFEFETLEGGLKKLTKINLDGWVCYGPSGESAVASLQQRLTDAEQRAEHWRSVASEATCRAAGLNALASSAIPRLPTVEMLDELTNGDTSKRKVMKLRWAQMLKVLPQEADPEPMGTSTTMDDGSIKTVLKNGLTTIVRDGQLEKVLAPADWTVKPNHVERAQVESSCICVDYVKFPPVNGAPEADWGRVVSEELKKAVALLESIKAQILEHHERGSYFATIMVLNTLPEISQLLREIKS